MLYQSFLKSRKNQTSYLIHFLKAICGILYV